MNSNLHQSVWFATLLIAMISLGALNTTYAQSSGNKPFLLMTPDDIWQEENVRALASAAGNGDLARVEELIREGVDINESGAFGATPIWWPAKSRNKEGFARLLELGADPNQLWGDNGSSLMDYIVRYSDPYFLQQALEHGADPNLMGNRVNVTPIFTAATYLGSSAENTRLLVEFGADVNVVSET